MKKKMNKAENTQNKIKYTNIYTTGVPKVVEGKEGGKQRRREEGAKASLKKQWQKTSQI